MSSNREDIDVNDPNFWQKWAKKANIETNSDPSVSLFIISFIRVILDSARLLQAELILYQPRTRKQRFNEEMYRISEDSNTESDEDSENGARRRGRKARGDDANYAPDELAFSKSDYFKIEKFLSSYGFVTKLALRDTITILDY